MIHKRHITILTVVLITDIPLIRKRIWISAQSLTTIFIHPTESRRATSGGIGVKRITILCLDSSTFRVRGNNGTILGTGLVVITSDIPLISGGIVQRSSVFRSLFTRVFVNARKFILAAI